MTTQANEPAGETVDEASTVEESIDAVMDRVGELVAPKD